LRRAASLQQPSSIFFVHAFGKSSASIQPEARGGSPLNARPFAEHAERFRESNTVFSMLCNGALTAFAETRVRTQKEATMFGELSKEERIHRSGEPEPSCNASQSFRSVSFVELRNTLSSDVEIVSPFVDQLMRFISRFRVADENNVEIELSLREALVNAIVHGNQEDPHKHVHVRCRCTADGEVSVTVEDEGNGFEPDAVPDPTSLDNRLRTDGRGIYLIRTLMDEVCFEHGGSVVRMRKNPTGKPFAQGRTQ
jgi:serine/threonine-protein kinase RsbW